MNRSGSTIIIQKDLENCWKAIANDEIFSIWYAPGSKWSIPNFEVGEQALFTLMPSAYNDLKEGESVPMTFTIKEIIPNRLFSYYWDANDMLFTIELFPESTGTRVQFNQQGFESSLANLKAYLEGKELPYC